MPNRKNLAYRRMKVQTNFVPPISFCDMRPKPITEDLVVVDVEELVEEIEEEDPLFFNLIDDLKSIRSNAKRKLEGWIIDNKDNINKLLEADKQNLMAFIQGKYFGK